MLRFLTDQKIKKTVFILSIIVFAYYLFGLFIISNMYKYPVVGAIMEIAALPMLALLLILPLIIVLQIIKERISFRSFPLYSFIILSCVLIMILMN